jgi:hypothetical protein
MRCKNKNLQKNNYQRPQQAVGHRVLFSDLPIRLAQLIELLLLFSFFLTQFDQTNAQARRICAGKSAGSEGRHHRRQLPVESRDRGIGWDRKIEAFMLAKKESKRGSEKVREKKRTFPAK